MREVDDGDGVSVREPLEEADVEAALLCRRVADLRARRGCQHHECEGEREKWRMKRLESRTHEGRELVVVADEDELVGEAERPEARRERDLRRLVDDAEVEAALDEDGPAHGKASARAFAGRALEDRTHSLMPRQVVATICGVLSLLSMSVSEFE